MARRLRASTPEVGRAARLHHQRRGGPFSEEACELLARESSPLAHPTGALGDGNLEHGLGQIHGDRHMLHADSSFPKRFGGQGDSGTSMPRESREESIPSLHLAVHRVVSGGGSLWQ
jgi:hypothetical protein